VLEVSEPEKCEYVATMATPAECREAVVQEVRDELKLHSGRSNEAVKDEL
jgi:Glucosidase II beta subunit-like protein